MIETEINRELDDGKQNHQSIQRHDAQRSYE
jgi:hypothetical protein